MLIVSHHAGEVRANLHSGDDSAAIHVERADERARPVLDRGLDHARIDHGPQRNTAMHAAGGDDDGAPRPDMNRFGALVDVAVLPEAFESCAILRVHSRRIAGLDSENPAAERLLADELIHMAVEHEPHALLASAEFERSGDDEAAVDPSRRSDRVARAAGYLPHGAEGRMPLAHRVAAVLRRHRASLDVGLVRELHDGPRRTGARHAAALVRAVDARETDVIVHHELPDLWRVVGPRPMQLAVVVAIASDTGGIDHRPVGYIPEQAVGIVFQIFRLDERSFEPQALRVGPRAVPLLNGVATAKRGPAAAVHQFAADVEVLLEDDHRRPEVARSHRRM